VHHHWGNTVKYTRTAAFAALGVAAALSLTACGGDDSGTDSSAKENTSSSSSESPKTGSSSGGGSSDDDGGGSAGGSGAEDVKSGSDDGAETSGGSENGSENGSDDGSGNGSEDGSDDGADQDDFCKVADLNMSAKDDKPDEKTGNVLVFMTNKSSSTCSVTGFPEVKLKDADGTSNPITRDDNQPRIAILGPGEKAVFNISYKTSPGGAPLESNPTQIEVTPPHETQQVTLRWPSGAVKGYYSDVLYHPIHANP
jgi:hypothetical protein